MLIFAFIFLILALCQLLLVGMLLSRPRIARTRWPLSAVLLSTLFWCLCEGLHHLLAAEHSAPVWIAQLCLTAKATVPAFLILLPLPFLTRRHWQSLLCWVLAALALLTLYLPWSPLAIVTTAPTIWGAYRVNGLAPTIQADMLIIYVLCLIAIIRSALGTTVGHCRTELHYLLVGSLCCLAGYVLDLYLTLRLSTTPFFALGLPGLTILNLAGVYSASQTRPQELRRLFRAGISVMLTIISSLLLLYLLILVTGNGYFATLAIPFDVVLNVWLVLVLLIFLPLKGLFSRSLDRFFYRSLPMQHQHYEQAIDAITASTDTSTLMRICQKILDRILRPQFAVFYLVTTAADNSTQLVRFDDGEPQTNDILSRELLAALTEQLRIVMLTDELVGGHAPFSAIGTQLAARHIAVVIPLQAEERAYGLLFLGEKLSGDSYTTTELDFLGVLGAQLAIAIEHAGFYARLQQMNDTLEQRVQERSRELTVANTQLLEADHAKDQFLAIVSHELLTPLTSILGWTEMARDSGTLVRREEALEVVMRNAQRQKRVVHDLLDISRVIHGKLEMDMHMVNLWTLACQVIEGIRPRAAEKSLAIILQPVDTNLPVMGDQVRIQQVVSNLLTNAIKFTPAGGQITVSGVIQDDCAVISVKDTGKGLAPDELQIIFEMFRQTEVQNSQGGLGLGLALARHILEMHGGIIAAESAGLHQGSTFTFRIPLAEEEELILIGDS